MKSTLTGRLDSHFTTVAALASAGLLSAAAPAGAAIVYSGVVNINIPSTTAGVYLNVVTGVNNVAPASAPGWDVNPYNSTVLNMFAPTGTAGPGGHFGGGTLYKNVAPGTLISAAGTYTGTGVATIDGTTPLNLNSSNNLVGFRFQNEATANAVNYGWMRISLSATAAGQPRAIVEYAYENTGAGINAGDTGAGAGCYANCDHSTAVPFLNVQDFNCFLAKYASNDAYANCDGSTTVPTLNVQDFGCFLAKFAAGCSAP